MAELLLNGIILILDMAGNGDLNLMKEVMLWMRPDPNAQSITDKPSSSGNYNARLFTSELSYFSGKIRGYFRYKERTGSGLKYEEILANPHILQAIYATTKSRVVPQIQLEDGTFVQDSSEIIDVIESHYPKNPIIPSAENNPKQRLASYLIELFADEWLLVAAFSWRWSYSRDSDVPNHKDYNALQWGTWLNSKANGEERLKTGKGLFQMMAPDDGLVFKRGGAFRGLDCLGCTAQLQPYWEENTKKFLRLLEKHLGTHDYLLGGRPSLGDFGIIGPVYAHLYNDPVPGNIIKTEFPLVAQYVTRVMGISSVNRSYDETIYTVDSDGKLVGRVSSSDNGDWLPNDEIPPTLIPMLQCFFTDFYPVLTEAMKTLKIYLHSSEHSIGSRLPEKSFGPTPGFGKAQMVDENGTLTHDFTIEGQKGRRMVIPYTIWMMQRLFLQNQVLKNIKMNQNVVDLLNQIGGNDMQNLGQHLDGINIRKEGGLLYSSNTNSKL